jgi:hypothetical protein
VPTKLLFIIYDYVLVNQYGGSVAGSIFGRVQNGAHTRLCGMKSMASQWKKV